jgi:hypothetical protein
MVDIIYFLIMLVVILMGFVFMGYLSFGHTLSHYKTIQDSFITCFAMMIGEFDYPELFLYAFLHFYPIKHFHCYFRKSLYQSEIGHWQ